MTAVAAPAPALKPLRHPRFWLGAWIGALLAAAAVQLFAARHALWRSAIGLVALGIALEIAQGAFTATRQMDVFDALANTGGVVLGMATVLTPLRDLLLRLQRR